MRGNKAFGPWQVLDSIGIGGGGEVFRVANREAHDVSSLLSQVATQVRGLAFPSGNANQTASGLIESLQKLINPPPETFAALKKPHKPADAEEARKCRERLELEIKAMSELSHPHIVRVHDWDKKDLEWFVMELHTDQTLESIRDRFQGKPIVALRAIRPIVDAVTQVHARSLVHRDIKPKNILIAKDGRLILGDFGIVYTMDSDRSRLTVPGETIQSKDWVPPWRRFDAKNFRPVDDVHMLGKLLYWMVFPRKNVDASQFQEDNFRPTAIFPGRQDVRNLEDLLSALIVTRERDCIESAEELLQQIDKTISAIELTHPSPRGVEDLIRRSQWRYVEGFHVRKHPEFLSRCKGSDRVRVLLDEDTRSLAAAPGQPKHDYAVDFELNAADGITTYSVLDIFLKVNRRSEKFTLYIGLANDSNETFWLAFDPHASSFKADSSHNKEWVFPLDPALVDGNWHLIRISLPECLAEVWSDPKSMPKHLRLLRLRGDWRLASVGIA